MKKVHLGCWHRFIPGFIHVDLCDFPHIDHKSGVDKLPFFEDNSIDLLYASHVFEYFDRTDAINVLAEWRRVLKPGGTLRLAVPDFEALIEIYKSTNDLNKILGPLYGRMEIQAVDKKIMLYHKTTYDKKSLGTLLESAGFENVNAWDWRETEHASIDDHSQAYFPHMDKENGRQVSLNLQTTKK